MIKGLFCVYGDLVTPLYLAHVQMKPRIYNILKDVRFWILVYFLIRLIGITSPPLEVGHNWRQTTVTMVARNFFEVDNNILYPRIDIAGEKSGITGMEFPLLNYLIYICSELFGYAHWYGRLINLLLSSIGVLYFSKLIARFFERKVALYASLILLSSIWFSFSRKIMPDTFAMSLVMVGIYHGLRYLYPEKGTARSFDLLLYFFLAILGVLSKLPSGFLLILFAIPIQDARILMRFKIKFLLASVLLIIPVLLWYFIWVPYLVQEYGFWHFFMGNSLSQGWSEIINHPFETLGRFYDDSLKYIGFAAFLGGLVLAFIHGKRLLLAVFVLSALSFSVIVFKAGLTFYHHNYYIIPFVPVMALTAGYGLSLIKKKWIGIILLVAIAIEGTINQQHDFRIKEKNLALMNLESDLDGFTDREDLILINSGDYPTPMYFAHRKGWVASNEQLLKSGYLDSLQRKGLKAVVILKNSFSHEIPINAEQALDNENYSIYRFE